MLMYLASTERSGNSPQILQQAPPNSKMGKSQSTNRWPHDYPPFGAHTPNRQNPDDNPKYYQWFHNKILTFGKKRRTGTLQPNQVLQV